MTQRLAQAAEIRLGRQRAPQYENGDSMVPYLRSANVVNGDLDLTDVKSMNFDLSEQAIFGLQAGDVLMTEGSGSAETVGTSAVWRSDLPGTVCFQNTLLRLRPRPGVTDGRFLAWWCRHAHASGRIAAVSSGANIQHVGSDGLKDLPILVPALCEQRRIADFLDDRVAHIDQIIAARGTQIDLMDEEARSTSDALLAPLQATWVRLGLLIRSVEQGWSPQCDAVPADDNEWGVLKVGAVQPGWFDPSENKRLPNGEPPRAEYEVRADDLLVTRANTPERVGFFTVVPAGVRDRLLLCDKIMRIRVEERLDPQFVALVGQSRRARTELIIAGTGTSGSMVNIRGDDVRSMAIPLLPIGVQSALVAAWRASIEDAASRRVQVARSIELLKEYKQSLITAAVTGELDVTTAGSGIPS